MHIVAIGWLFVIVLVALTQPSIFLGVTTLLFGGLLPVGLLIYLTGSRARRRKRDADEEKHSPPPEA